MKPTRKVSVGALAGAVVAILLFSLSVFDPAAADKINIGVAAGLSTVIATALSYLIPEADQV